MSLKSQHLLVRSFAKGEGVGGNWNLEGRTKEGKRAVRRPWQAVPVTLLVEETRDALMPQLSQVNGGMTRSTDHAERKEFMVEPLDVLVQNANSPREEHGDTRWKLASIQDTDVRAWPSFAFLFQAVGKDESPIAGPG